MMCENEHDTAPSITRQLPDVMLGVKAWCLKCRNAGPDAQPDVLPLANIGISSLPRLDKLLADFAAERFSGDCRTV